MYDFYDTDIFVIHSLLCHYQLIAWYGNSPDHKMSGYFISDQEIPGHFISDQKIAGPEKVRIFSNMNGI